MSKDYKRFSDENDMIDLVLWALVYAFFCVSIIILSVLFTSCGSNKIVYRQKETRLLKPVDSLNMKVEPSKVIRYD